MHSHVRRVGTSKPNGLISFSRSDVSASGDSPGSSVKNKHDDAEDDLDAERHEVKRLKFSKEEDEDDEEEEEVEQEAETLRPAHVAGASKEAEAMVQEEEKVESSKESHAPSSALAAEDQGEGGASELPVTSCLWWER